MPTFSEVPVLQGFLRDATATSGSLSPSFFLHGAGRQRGFTTEVTCESLRVNSYLRISNSA
jgi:hypothetical protein